MNTAFLSLLGVAVALTAAHAETIRFEISPPGADQATGLSALNEVLAPDPEFASDGTGDTIGSGILFDTTSRVLSFSIGYGSSQGFNDLSAPAFAWLLHGPAPVQETAPVMFDLSQFHEYAADPALGGVLDGSLVFSPAQANYLLSGLVYLNIYTEFELGGEIRGQLIPADATVPDTLCTLWFVLGLGIVLIGVKATVLVGVISNKVA